MFNIVVRVKVFNKRLQQLYENRGISRVAQRTPRCRGVWGAATLPNGESMGQSSPGIFGGLRGSALRVCSRVYLHIIFNIKYTGANMRSKSCHISGSRPFAKMIIWQNASQSATKGSSSPKGCQTTWRGSKYLYIPLYSSIQLHATLYSVAHICFIIGAFSVKYVWDTFRVCLDMVATCLGNVWSISIPMFG